ncbi:GDSL esterase/lipase At5g03610-like [Triticum dicoccoides]|uniref:GDSL esterase/lipase At5g03610-like n=1 Tax=Triticum dicoccoides TaxID=85692 RepID=UPI0018906479|nr:GDSL esterase/lipase At5g03610-like [Triticum dicoccoides]
MKLPAIVPLACAILLLLVNLNVSPVESSRPHPPGQGHHHDHDHDHDRDGHDHDRHGRHHHDHDDYDGYSFYVFGDSFADNGNLPHKDGVLSPMTRQWYTPYSGTGRFSNGNVQSDFIANMLGQSGSPPARRLHDPAGREGMNFAAGGSGVFQVSGTKTLHKQVHIFKRLVRQGDIDQENLGNSVALVAVSGNDYNHIGVDTSGFADITAFVDNVTTEIQANVKDLLEAGVQKVLVNNLFPLGCAPSQTKPNHTECNDQANQGASLHNRYLSAKLADMDNVRVLDLNAAFNTILAHHADGRGAVAKQFGRKLRPCCEPADDRSYCGLTVWDTNGVDMVDSYQVCPEPERAFFWDEMNPTNAGWAAVMGQLESSIKEFLGLDS